MLDWPCDIAEIADRLGIDKFSVMGVSAGGPYALACAFKIPERLAGCGLVSTLSPGDMLMKAGPAFMRLTFWVGTYMPYVFKAYLRLTVTDKLRVKVADGKYLLRYASLLAEADKQLLSDPEVNKTLTLAMSESYKQGAQAGREAAITLGKPWGFRAEDIEFEHIFLWHGEKDGIMSIAPTRLFAQSLRNCEATYYLDESHFSTVVNHVDEIFTKLKG